MNNTMHLKDARKIAKQCNRKLQVKTISFADLTRESKRFFTLTPDFSSTFSCIEELVNLKKSLNDSELQLFNLVTVYDDKGTILKA